MSRPTNSEQHGSDLENQVMVTNNVLVRDADDESIAPESSPNRPGDHGRAEREAHGESSSTIPSRPATAKPLPKALALERWENEGGGL